MSLALAIDRLMLALDSERAALVSLDGEALRGAGEEKLAALDSVNEALQGAGPGPDFEARLRDAFERHQANAELLLRRRQETSWLLRMLGAVDSPTAYDASGDRRDATVTRRIAEA